MGISSPESVKNKRIYKALADLYGDFRPRELQTAIGDFFHAEARISVVHPINELVGAGAMFSSVLAPMLQAFDNLYRRTDMLLGGEYNGAEWVAGHGHFVGTFARDWLGIPASGEIMWLHFAEFHRMEQGRASETYLYFDMLDLLRQIGKWPLPKSRGYEGFVPGPATNDGVILSERDPEESHASLKMVDDMLSRLYTKDEAWRPYWHRNMYWYGPSGYGSYVGVDGFARFQLPYESIFDPEQVVTTYRKSSDPTLNEKVKGHYARFADGNYIASGGWPSHGGFMVKPWLGIEAKRQMFTVRVADFWRRDGDVLVENWVFVDLVDMLLQLGFDVFRAAGVEISLNP